MNQPYILCSFLVVCTIYIVLLKTKELKKLIKEFINYEAFYVAITLFINKLDYFEIENGNAT